MRVAVLGTGVVGRTLAAALAAFGDDVVLGTRDPAAVSRGDSGALAELLSASPALEVATFAGAVEAADLIVLCVGGAHALAVVGLAGPERLAGKVVIDACNPLDFSRGFPPTLTVCNTSSLGEQVQAAAPSARVVKALNTVSSTVMVDPSSVGGGVHDLFICGNDAEAKREVAAWLRGRFGWQSMIDLGDISSARGTEMYLALWTRTMAALGTERFNVHMAR